jgi:nickel superoxide dismutase
MNFLSTLSSVLPTEHAFAHCDVPCGIYTPNAARTAAQTVLKMVQKLQDLKIPEDGSPDGEYTKHHNDTVRMIMTKEEHAQICKRELLILWTDYFKPEHLSSFPDLHDVFWQATKLCSKNKQHVDVAAAQELVDTVEKIATMFQKAAAAH